MIHLGLHTDNWRPLSVGFEAACEKIAATGLKHIEFCAIHGQNFIAALGYDPGVSLQSNPRAIRRFVDKLGTPRERHEEQRHEDVRGQVGYESAKTAPEALAGQAGQTDPEPGHEKGRRDVQDGFERHGR